MVKIKRSEQGLYNKEMVILARESRGLTLQELADKIDFTKGALSQVENGLVGITKDLIQKISKALNYPIEFFKLKDPILDLDTSYYRKKRDISKKDLKRSEAEINITKMNVEKFLLSVEPPAPNYPKIEIAEENTPEKAAQYVRQFWKLHGKIDNLTQLLEDNGIFILPIDFKGLEIDGLSIVTEKNTPIIFVNKDIPSDRTRLTIAHELGHIVMHTGKAIPDSRDEESEAFLFGAELLMPKKEILESLKGLTIEKMVELKKEWKVSMGALIVRAKRTGAITDEQYQALWKQMAKLGYRRQEPEETEFTKEESTLLKEIIDAHIKELLYTEKQLAAFLCLSHEELVSKYLSRKPRLKIIRGGLK